MSKPPKYAVIGHPIQHSLSPFIHQKFAEQCQINLIFEAIDLTCSSVEDLALQLSRLCLENYLGLSVTVPYKIWAFEILREKNGLSERAQKAGAVNMIAFKSQDNWVGDITDGVGLIRDLKINLKWPIKDQNVLLLGAGGAVKGILPNLLSEFPHSVDIVNRNVEKAERLVAGMLSPQCVITASDQIDMDKHYDLVINGTSASLEGKLPEGIERLSPKNTYFYDMLYGKSTVFLEWAAANGALAVSDGFGMLVEQAAEAFYKWHNVPPNTSKILAERR